MSPCRFDPFVSFCEEITLNLTSVPLPPPVAFFLLVWILYFISISTKENSHRTMYTLVNSVKIKRDDCWAVCGSVCYSLCLLSLKGIRLTHLHIFFTLYWKQNLLLCLCAGNVTCMRIYLKLASLMNFSFKIHHKSNTGTNQYQIKLNHKQPKISWFGLTVMWHIDTTKTTTV